MRWSILWGPAFVFMVACSGSHRIEPIVLEDAKSIKMVTAEFDDAETVKQAKTLALAFSKAAEDGRCETAWKLLSTRYRKRFRDSSDTQDPVKLFCDGYVLKGDFLAQNGWKETILGERPLYVTTPPPELDASSSPDQALFYVVQQNGSYTSFLVVNERGQARIEPF